MGEITNPKEEFFKNGSWIWDGSEWIKSGAIPGHIGAYFERQVDLTAAAGLNTFDFTVVPANQICVVTTFHAVNVTTATDYIDFFIYDDPYYFIIDSSRYDAVTRHLRWSGHLYVPAGYMVRVNFCNSVLNDDIVADVTGYKLSIP